MTHERAAAAHQLRQVAELAGEYGELAERTGNGDLAALVFQLRIVLAVDQVDDGVDGS